MGLVLIVDDDERNAKLARDVLERSGFRVICAATAGAALELARAHRPSAVLMDLRLPDMDGADAARLLAADERTAGIPVLALSAVRAEEAESWWRDAGFSGYVEKPIDVRLLPRLVRAAFR